LREEIGHPRKVLLGADRLDYTKGIDMRLLAFERLLERQAEIADETVFVQIAAPSREPIGDYEAMRARIEQLVGRINGSHGAAHTVPVHYVYGTIPTDELVAYYVLADVMCVTPLADGMNLVAKEYIASRPGDEGVLVLSEFAGAAAELEGPASGACGLRCATTTCTPGQTGAWGPWKERRQKRRRKKAWVSGTPTPRHPAFSAGALPACPMPWMLSTRSRLPCANVGSWCSSTSTARSLPSSTTRPRLRCSTRNVRRWRL